MLQAALLAEVTKVGPGPFVDWVQDRLRDCDVLGTMEEGLWKGEMMRLLGVSQNAFQWWEKKSIEMDYPALDVPRKRMPGTATVARYYPLSLVVKVLKWYWERSVYEKESTFEHAAGD